MWLCEVVLSAVHFHVNQASSCVSRHLFSLLISYFRPWPFCDGIEKAICDNVKYFHIRYLSHINIISYQDIKTQQMPSFVVLTEKNTMYPVWDTIAGKCQFALLHSSFTVWRFEKCCTMVYREVCTRACLCVHVDLWLHENLRHAPGCSTVCISGNP